MKDLFYSVSLIIGIIILLFISGKVALDNIAKANSDLNEVSKTVADLQNKLTALQKVSPTVSNGSEEVIKALPTSTQIFTVLGEIRSTADANGLVVTGYNAGSSGLVGTIPGVSSQSLNFEMLGGYGGITSLVNSLKTFAPLTTLDSFSIAQDQTTTDVYKVIGLVSTYWSALPTTFTPVAGKFSQLTSEEQDILNRISALSIPASVASTGSAPSGRSNPFAF